MNIEMFSENEIIHLNNIEKISNIKWTEHPECKGVYIKHLIKGCKTSGLFSSHIVKISPNCTIKKHTHENQMELHEVIAGKGFFQIKDKSLEYSAGKISLIQKGEEHMVSAGEKGLTLLAKFFPALI